MSGGLRPRGGAVVVVGSGTDAGKTFVACRLIEDLRARGLSVMPRKPVVTGFHVDDMDGSDPGRLLRAAGLPLTHLERVTPWRLRAPVAPDAAARAEGVTISFTAVVACCDAPRAECDVVVIETAGGVMSPLTEATTQLDLVAAMPDAAVVLVVDASYLGAISHGLTAMTALRSAGRTGSRDAVVVVNRGDPEPFARFLPGAVVVGVDARAALAEAVVARMTAPVHPSRS